ncbi:MAG TPA: class I SAM-dependent methyltransferase [Sneathiellales bacterium]|jgi:SAM-dependent methyltransferase|nr:class I SAM-dependent methyltransferase [Sneathiellales bacterium]
MDVSFPAPPLAQSWQSEAFGDISVHVRGCPLCGGVTPETGKERYCRDIWRVVDCRDCGFVYLGKAPDYAEMFEKLAWEKSSKVEEQRRETERAFGYKLSKKTRARLHLFPRKDIVELISRYAAPGPVVDLGCGDGAQVANLGPEYIPCGIEISGELADRARARLTTRKGTIVTAPSLLGLKKFPDAYFTGALLRSYLEHEAAPLPVLQELARTLAPGGIAVIKVPNYGSLNRRVMGARWCGFRFPDHLNYFTPKSLRQVVEIAGLKVRRFGIMDRLPTGDNMWMIVAK